MNTIFSTILLLAVLQGVYPYSKFGRKCDDIGCASNEECVIASKPCSFLDRKDECGEYPTCKKIDNGVRTCETYVCPPSKVCRIDGGIPKCFDDSSKIGKVPLYDTSNINNKYDSHGGQAPPNSPSGNYNPSAPSGNYNPSAPNPSRGSIYPNIGSNGNTHQGGYNPGYQQPAGGVQRPMGNYGGYQQPSNTYGGYPSSGGNQGYNRPAGGYGQQNVGYGQQNGGYGQQNPGSGGFYGQGGYNGQGYNRPQQQPGAPNGYYVAGAGYQQPSPNNGYNNRNQNTGYGYNQGYGGYGSNTGNTGYGQYGTKGSTGSSFTDSLKDALKKIGLLIIVSHYISQHYWR